MMSRAPKLLVTRNSNFSSHYFSLENRTPNRIVAQASKPAIISRLTGGSGTVLKLPLLPPEKRHAPGPLSVAIVVKRKSTGEQLTHEGFVCFEKPIPVLLSVKLKPPLEEIRPFLNKSTSQ